MHLFFSAGEPSGDQHAARVIEQLRQRAPGIRCSGFGGPEMERAGLRPLYDLTQLAVMGFGGIVPLLSTFRDLYGAAKSFLATERPDAVILVDFPGFNWWVARAAKAAGVPVYYYCPPQLWAWAPWRIYKMRRLVDAVLAVLPFEADWYRRRGMDVSWVGHPFFDEAAHTPLNPEVVGEIRSAGSFALGILPGSRKQEVNGNFPIMLRMMEHLYQRHPGVTFPVACYKSWHHDRCRQLLDAHPAPLPVTLFTGQTAEVIEAADCCLMVSGSVSLELLARRTPAVVMYKLSLGMWCLARMLATCKFITLPNLIADSAVMPEFPFVRSQGPHIDQLTEVLDRWISSPVELAQSRQRLERVANGIVEAGGVVRAAEEILRRIGQTPAAVSRAA